MITNHDIVDFIKWVSLRKNYSITTLVFLNHWHKYICTACSASKSVIKNGQSMRVFAHEVNCWPVLLCMLLCKRASDVQTVSYIRQNSSVFVVFNQFSTDNASFKAKNIRAGSPDLFVSMTWTVWKNNLGHLELRF